MALNKTLSFDLELKPGGIPPIIHASQGDIGRMFKANIYWDGAAATSYVSGATVNLRGKKPDKTVFDYTATLAGSMVTFETTEQMTIISGPVECELVFSNDGDIIASANFLLIVEASPYDPNAISESEVQGINAMIQAATPEAVADWFENDAATSEVFASAVNDAVNDYADTEGLNLTRDTNGVVRLGSTASTGTAGTITGFYVHDKVTDTDGVAKYDYDGLENAPDYGAELYGGTVATVLPSVESGYYVDANGELSVNSGYVSTNYIPISLADTVIISCTIFQGISVVLTDIEKNVLFFINGNNCADYGYTASTQPQTITLNVPENAYYIRASQRSIYYDNPTSFNVSYTTNGIKSRLFEIYTPIVTVGSNGDYSTILEALKNTADNVRIKVLAGTYDIVQEYLNYYGSDFWNDYAGYANNTDNFLRGLWVTDGRTIEFDSQAIVTFDYTGTNTNVAPYFSIFATGYNAKISGLHVVHTNTCRYAIHDDQAWKPGVNVFERCLFDGTSAVGYEIGGGMGANNIYVIDNCVFLNNNGTRDISYHNNGGTTARNKLFVSNCYGEKACTMLYHGTSTKKTYCFVNGSHFSSIGKTANTTGSNVDNIELIAWGNITD